MYVLQKNTKKRAENGTRTRDPDLGKVVLYQLSYFRNFSIFMRDKTCEEEETRTPTSHLTLPPQSSASTNSATSPSIFLSHVEKRVPRTGLEPARLAAHAPETCASTNSATWAFYDGYLSRIALLFIMWSGKRDSDPRPRPWQGRALPTELFPPLKPLVRTISLDCGCKGNAFLITNKIFKHFFAKKFFAVTAVTAISVPSFLELTWFRREVGHLVGEASPTTVTLGSVTYY